MYKMIERYRRLDRTWSALINKRIASIEAKEQEDNLILHIKSEGMKELTSYFTTLTPIPND